MRIPATPLEIVRSMNEREWQDLLERQEKRMRRKGRRICTHAATTQETHLRSRVDQNLQRFVLTTAPEPGEALVRNSRTP